MKPPPTDRQQSLLRPKRKQACTINVVTLNCRTLRSATQKNQLARTLNDLNASFGCLQETRITSPDPQFEENVPPPNTTSNRHPQEYKLYASSADNGNAGCAVAVRNDLDALVHSWKAVSSRLVYVHIREAAQPTWILSAYAPHNDRPDEEKDAFYEQFEAVLKSIPRSHLVLVGTDANAQFGASESSSSLGRWYFPADETTDNGTRILSLAEEHDLMLANTLKRNRLRERVTHDNVECISRELKQKLRADHHVSQLDYVLIRSRWAADVLKAGSIPNAPFNSDHRPVRVQVRLQYKPPKQSRQKRYAVNQLHQAGVRLRYQAEILAHLEPTERRRAAAVPTIEGFTKAMIAARNVAVPEVRPQKKRPLLSVQAERLAATLATAKRNKPDEVKRIRNSLRNRLKKDREEVWEQRIKEMDEAWRTGNSRKVYTMLRLYSGRLKAAPSTLQEEGRCVANKHCLSVWRRHFQELLNRPPPDGPEFVPERRPEYAISSDPPNVDEVAQALTKLRNNKAAGPDDVQPELLKALPEAAVRQYTEALRQVWDREQIPDEWRRAVVIPLHKKGCATDPTNYRGISLLSVQYKLLERIIADRILAERDKRTRDEQAGFRPGRSTIDQILILRRIVETRSRFAQPFHIGFLDFACAFDSPDRGRIYKLLTADGVPEKLVRIIQDMNTDSEAVVRTRAGISDPFAVATGVRQGSVLGPMLFNFVIDAVLNEAVKEFDGGIQLLPSTRMLTDLEYADDIALISRCRRELQRFLDRVDALGRRFGLRLKPSKCEVISTEPDADPITIAGEPLKESDRFCYLGSVITRDGSVRPDITQRLNKARAAFSMLQQCLWSTSISTRMKLRVYASAIRPILLYAAETWQMTQSEQELVDKAERRFLRKILDVRFAEKVTNVELYARAKPVISCRLSDYVAERRLRLLRHLLRRPPERLTRLALEHMPDNSWKRKRGGRKNTWPEMLKNDLKTRGFGNRFHGTDANQAWQSNNRWLLAVTLFAEDRKTWDQCVKGATSMPRSRLRDLH